MLPAPKLSDVPFLVSDTTTVLITEASTDLSALLIRKISSVQKKCEPHWDLKFSSGYIKEKRKKWNWLGFGLATFQVPIDTYCDFLFDSTTLDLGTSQILWIPTLTALHFYFPPFS